MTDFLDKIILGDCRETWCHRKGNTMNDLLEKTFLGIEDSDLEKLEAELDFEGHQLLKAKNFSHGVICRFCSALAAAERERREKLGRISNADGQIEISA